MRDEKLLFLHHINTKDNTIADASSRFVKTETEYSLSSKAFQEIVKSFGRPQIDLFASYQNKKCEVFISWYPDPQCSEIDAFTLNWSKIDFYAFPPFSLLSRVIKKIKFEKAKGIVVFPIWKSQPWFPTIEELRISELIKFTPQKRLLLSACREPHPMWRNLTLGAAVLSG